MAVAAVGAAAVVGAASSAYSASKQAAAAKKPTTTSTGPWGPQVQPIMRGLDAAEEAFGRAQGVDRYSGPFDAGVNPNLQAGWDGTAVSAPGSVAAGGAVQNAGLAGLPAFGQGVNNAGDLYNRAGADQTAATIARAGQFADNPYIDGAIDASLRDVNRNLQLDLGRNNSNAVGSGNMNSTRAGVTEALLTQGAQDRAADISSGMRFGAYNNGLNLGAQQIQQGFQNQQTANATLLQAGTNAAGMVGQGAGIQQNANDSLTRAGLAERAVGNESIAGALREDSYNVNHEFDVIDRYMGIVGRPYGSESVTTRPYTGPDPLSAGLQGGIGAGMQAYGMYNMMSSPQGGPRGYSQATYGTYPTGYGNYVAPQYAYAYP